MGLIREAAAQLAAEMQRQGRSEAVVYTLNTGSGFHDLTRALEISEVLLDIEGEVDMVIGKLSIHQLELLGAARK